MKYVGALDQGTTSTRFILFDKQANAVATSQCEHRQHFPAPGWVEHDAAEIWANACAVISDALRKANVEPENIEAIGVTNQRETIAVWDRTTGEPLHHALVWQDTRTADFVDSLDSDALRRVTGLPAATYFSASKLRWLLREVPTVRNAVRQGRALAGTIDCWLVWKLTGAHVTDVTNAGRTQLMDLRALDWSDDMLRLFEIPREILPTIHASSSSSAYGGTLARNPLGEGTPVTALVGDQQAALFGQACFRAGEAKCTYGTGAFLLMHTGEEIVHSRHGLLTTPVCRIEGQPAGYALEGSVAIAGSLVQWLRDNLGLINDSSEIEALAASVPDTGGITFAPAFTGLFAPHWDATARGVITGLTHHTTRAHIARAALEATALQTAEIVEAMRADTGLSLEDLRVDGGMTANGLLMQFQADILGSPVSRQTCTETTALGAAFAAGLATGFWRGLPDLRELWSDETRWTPHISEQQRERLLSRWRDAVERTRGLASFGLA